MRTPLRRALCLALLTYASSATAQLGPHFSDCVAPTGQNASLILPLDAVLTVSPDPGDADPVTADDELAVFTPEGACAGTLAWDEETEATALAVWEDNPVTALKDGFVPGDTLRYSLWDASSSQEIDGTAVRYEPYADPTGIYTPDAVYFVAELAFGDRGTTTGGEETAAFAFTFEPNYPNPFVTSTTFRYALPEAAHVRLEVYDLLGRRVATLADEEAQPGWHERRFDADGLSNGAYIARITAGAHADTQRITLMR